MEHDAPPVQIADTQILDTFAEAFGMRYVRPIVTAHDEYWLDAALAEFTGYSSSVIACDAETGLERRLSPEETPDGRVGAALLAFAFSTDGLAKAVPNRVGQCVMTCPTTAVFDGADLAADNLVEKNGRPRRIPLGKQIRYFGDGFQKSKQIAGRRYWRIPVMDGEFLIEESLAVANGIAGGNIILQASSVEAALAAARRATEAIATVPGTITPFPGGVARSGSKVGSRYKGLVASTSDGYCPTLIGRVETQLVDGCRAALEIVIDGVSETAVADAMRAALRAAAGDGVLAIGAGNYGGKLGKYHFKLHELLAS
ncbi:MAG: formylmethanofuran--tetrahydromethanopterin N-formyltransferase [Planctomycetota bacterium]|nr:MAG: formylmethanofuran--tetrahydromethanopterin N-formyltransferase [Planctomycetota bacterium]REJ97583.1 MAG: formylmethanofuran--tetrahydromethanopterin N-formyltransferase [Planctomycetota bacterium]REK23005.1 MAG: formylmethanofuran--tetrahydromethanopterin N-formyltransferase [Planctomycetota bacterium]REK43368.1 MAG: formylmethanofuran--tetrahydromethanopterin N-formyltransferase [Planctomycetota bacterium]